jgi:uncharacterized DUF497 family protein
MARKVFEWDDPSDPDGNVAHIAAHGVTTQDAERVVRDPNNRQQRSRSSGYPVTFGWTKDRRFLMVVWFGRGQNPEVVRVITAYEIEP